MAQQLHSSNLDYYDRMQELEERLKRSEEERMLLQRQFDLLMQANQEKERARVSVVEARYKRFLDEDKRRRDRNSSLLQALDRIDSHTASLAAKTERMRALRKHYETFIAHSYPGWHAGIERPYCPLAAIAPAPNVMARVTDVTGYHTESFPDPGDFSETQYHALPSVTSKPFCPIGSPLCRSDLAIASREDCPVVGRSPYRSGSAAIRSASLSPSRVRDLSSQYDTDKISSFKNYDLYSPSKSPDVKHSARLKNVSHFSQSDAITSPRPSRYLGNISQGFGEDKQIRYQPISSTNHHILDYDHGNSDIELDQNTSGDFLNLSNLSLSDDGVLNDPDDSPLPYSAIHSYSSPRDYTVPKKSPSVSLPLPSTSLRHISSRDIFIPKRSGTLSPSIFTGSSPKSILSPCSRKSDIPSSLPLSDSVQRILLSTDDMDSRRSDASLSPRRHKPTWQTLRPSYLPPPPRNTIRRSVTFTEPEYESPCIFRDEDIGLYSGSYGSLRRHSPSAPTSNWESSDHERYLRDKQGREKDAFREKIERLKELIQENKEQEGSMTNSVPDPVRKFDLPQPEWKDYDQHEKSRENSLDRDWKVSQSRRPSIAREIGSDSEEQFPKAEVEASRIHDKISEALECKVSSTENDDEPSETISDKEQWSGQFNEKDEDAKEKVKISEVQDDTDNFTKLDGPKNLLQNTDLDNDYSTKLNETPIFKSEMDVLDENVPTKIEKDNEKVFEKISENYSNQEQALDGLYQNESQLQGKEISDYTSQDSQQQQQESVQDAPYEEEKLSKEPSDFNLNDQYQHEQETNSNFQSDQHQGNDQQSDQQQEDQDKLVDSYNYDGGQQQQEWTTSEDSGAQDAQQNMQYTYEQSDPSSAAYEEQNQDHTRQESGFEQYPTDGEKDQQSYEKYQSDANQQPQTGYGTYQEPQQTTESANDYQNYTEDSNQYQQNYQTYPEEQQYSEQQDQNYTAGDQSNYQYPQDPSKTGDQSDYQYPQDASKTGDQSNYQYPQDPSKTQYKYEGQEYDYQQNPDSYNYPQDQNYQQDTAYQQDPSYQQDQSYQDQNYQQDQQYQQDPNYQQGQQFQETGYDGAQQYEGYQPGPDDLSEDTTQSADVNYQGQFKGGDATDQQQTLDQYRAVLGTDPSSEPAYSDSSELENQMAAVVGQTGNSATGLAEPAVSTPSPTTPSTPTAASGTGKGKAGAKKKPQLTRKQSSIAPENVPAVAQQQSDSDFDVSSSH